MPTHRGDSNAYGFALCYRDAVRPTESSPMPKVNPVQATTQGFGFVVTQGNRPAANFEFKSKEDADAAHEKMQQILAKCHSVRGFA